MAPSRRTIRRLMLVVAVAAVASRAAAWWLRPAPRPVERLGRLEVFSVELPPDFRFPDPYDPGRPPPPPGWGGEVPPVPR